LVTGATGFVGKHLAHELVKTGNEVHILARPRREPLPSILKGTQVHWLENSDSVLEVMKQTKPQVVFHLASLFMAEHDYKNVEALCTSQITFGTQLVDAMAQTGVTRLVAAGTSWQNFSGEKGVAACLYAATKEAFESILRYYASANGLYATVLKLYDTYGPQDTRAKLLSLLRQAWQEEKKTLGLSPGEQKIDLVHVQDIVRAFIQASARKNDVKQGKVEEFYLSSKRFLSLRELVDLSSKVLEKPIPVKFAERPYRAREVMIPWQQGPYLPDWEPKITLEEGLKSYFKESSHV
jgi:nucleoside-diphosphate-sugar epimerase